MDKKIKLLDIRKKLYFIKFNILFNKALEEGKITGFDEEIFEKMKDTIITCLPVSLYIKYSNYLLASLTCYDKSLYMFLALNDAILVRGNSKELEYNYGKGNDRHGFIELGDFVYDPSLMLRFDKDVYYSLYGISDVIKIDRMTYLQQNKDFVCTYVSHDLDEFRPNGKKRFELGILIFQIKALSQFLEDEQFAQDLDNYLVKVKYDEEQIVLEREKEMQKMLKSIISEKKS